MDFERILQEKWTNPLRKGYVTVNGVTLPQVYEAIKDEIDNLEVKEEDIWLCTYPKCGATWTQEMVWLIVNNLDFEGAKISIWERFSFLERAFAADIRNVTDANFKVPLFIKDPTGWLKLPKSSGCIKTHLPLKLLPKQIRNETKNPKLIYVTRDPRDACVSFYHHAKLIDNFTATFEEFCELFLEGKVYYGLYWEHVLPFWKRRNLPNILFLKYEDMKCDLGKVVRQVAEFLQRPLSHEDLGKLTKHLSFDSMRKNPAVNYEKLIDHLKTFHNNINDDGEFMRRGVVGDHKRAMSPEIINKFNEWIENNIQGSDYVI